MLNPTHPLAELLRRDKRYHFDSYIFVFDSLRYAQERLNMGRVVTPSSSSDSSDFQDEFDENEFEEEDFDEDELSEDQTEQERHVTGQDLCEAIRRYALAEYGLMAKSVLNHWGVHSTGDFGEIVFNLIDIGQMRKTDSDRREDFNDVFDFADALSDSTVFNESGDKKRSSERSD